MGGHRILLVEDEAAIRFGIRGFLQTRGFEVDEASSCQSAQEAFRAARAEVVLLDYRLPDGNALDLLPKLKELDPSVAILILTGHGSIDLAVQALQKGAEHFLTKPVELNTLEVVLSRIFENQRNRQKPLPPQTRQAQPEVDPFVGTTPAIRALAQQAQRVSSSNSPVLLLGETGTGKGVLAGWLHRHGSRRDEAFVDLNCAGLAQPFLESELFGHERGAFTGAVTTKPGLFEVAHRGTLFLDEIGDMDLQVQPKLLKALEEKRFRRLGDVRDRWADLRLIAATHQDLPSLVHAKTFRSDLYFRISAIPLAVPPLRARVADILPIAERVLSQIATELGRSELRLSSSATSALLAYSWPGNIRELRNVLERAALFCATSQISPDDFYFQPLPLAAPAPKTALSLMEVEKQHIAQVLAEEDGRVDRAAKRLGLPRSSLYAKIRRYRLRLARD